MIEGLWATSFRGSRDEGTGVAVFQAGRISGGSGSFFYTGTYSVSDGLVHGTVTATRYGFPDKDILGPMDTGESVHLEFSAGVAPERISGTATRKDHDGVVKFAMRKLTGLP